MLGQPGAEREERDDLAPRDDVPDEEFLGQLVEAEFEVGISVDPQSVHHPVEDDGVTVQHFRDAVTQAATHVVTYLKKRWTMQGILKGKYHCTVDLLFDLFGHRHLRNGDCLSFVMCLLLAPV